MPTKSPEPSVGDDAWPTDNSIPFWDTTKAPVHAYQPPKGPDILEDDDYLSEWQKKTPKEKAEAEWEEISHDKNVKIVSIVFGVTGFLLLLIVAHKLIDNPDGCCGKICRCLIACVRIVCWPVRALCCRSTRARDRRTHQLVSGEPGTYGYSHDLELT